MEDSSLVRGYFTGKDLFVGIDVHKKRWVNFKEFYLEMSKKKVIVLTISFSFTDKILLCETFPTLLLWEFNRATILLFTFILINVFSI